MLADGFEDGVDRTALIIAQFEMAGMLDKEFRVGQDSLDGWL